MFSILNFRKVEEKVPPRDLVINIGYDSPYHDLAIKEDDLQDIEHKSKQQLEYINNRVRTTKYTPWSFLLKNLYEQFQRVANIYFLFLIILQLIPQIGDGRRAAGMGSLAFGTILVITMIKDGYEDYNRYLSDRDLNNSKTHRLRNWYNFNLPRYKRTSLLASIFSCFSSKTPEEPITEKMETEDETLVLHELPSESEIGSLNHWNETLWEEVQVGDILMVRADEAIPADIILLKTSEPDGTCFVETKNLDGETNLKVRNTLKFTSDCLNSIDDLKREQMVVEAEPANVNLYSFKGNIKRLDKDFNEMEKESISINNLLLRGCVLRNVEYAIGLVVYTGHDTKIVLNSGDTPSKKSYIEKMMNKQVMINFLILIGLALSVSISGAFFYSSSKTSSYLFVTNFIKDKAPVSLSGFLGFFTCLILFQNIVPISLYLTVEMVKSIQAYFIHCDVEMYYKPLDKLCQPRAWNLSDDLGQIEYVFSDKTGTLTQNVMEFKQCSIGGVMYGQDLLLDYSNTNVNTSNNTNLNDSFVSSSEQPLLTNEEEDIQFDDKSSTGSNIINATNDRLRIMGEERFRFTNNKYRSGPMTFVDPQLYMDLRNIPERKENIIKFFTILSICHTVLCEIDHLSQSEFTNIQYKAESPDEAALVAGAANVGFTFLSRIQDKIEVDILGTLSSYRILNVLEFNSTRKRTSVIVQPLGSDDILLYCKGADSMILERLKDKQSPLVDETLNHLKAFAQTGLRTLCIAYRKLTKEEYEQWEKIYSDANSSLKDRDQKVMDACEMMEKDLELVGGTAIEDKLQDGVPESIALLREAGIKIWVLTGDKTETAISIGFSCNLLDSSMELISVTGTTKEEVSEQLERALDLFVFEGHPPLALVIDGASLKYALELPVNDKLLRLGKECKVVLCCRVSPLQKAQVVSLVKDGLDAMSLAIGDGANDVSMIQAAHIGVGIAGLEGCQAVMSSDYAIAQFRYLTRLLLVHGRWSYIRISHMILCFFYKNLVMTLTNFWFQWFNGPSQTFLFDYALVLCYNLVFTAFPIMVLGAFDQDVSAEVALVTPQLYLRGIKHMDYSHKRFFIVVLDAIYQSLVCFFVPYIMFGISTFSDSGSSNSSLDGFGTAVAACVVVTTNLFVGLFTFNWTFISFLVIFGSIINFFLIVLVFSHIVKGMHSIDALLFANLYFWMVVLLTVFACLLPRFLSRFIRAIFRPTDIELIREQVILFYSYIKRQKRYLRRKNREATKRQQVNAQAVADGLGLSSLSRMFSLANQSYTPFTGYAFSADDVSPLSERLRATMLKNHIEKNKDTELARFANHDSGLIHIDEDYGPDNPQIRLIAPTPYGSVIQRRDDA